MRIKHLYVLGIAMLLNIVSKAQSANFGQLQNNILPHSPEAEAMVKRAALPVTLYTGLPQINVPIFEIKGKSLSIPVSLGYNYNGFKPTESASFVGLGWSIQGGGVITRMIKGRVDHEDPYINGKDFDDFIDVNIMAERKQPVIKDIAEGYADGEPDLYVFNCNGLSGKFILLKDRAYLFPHQNIDIEKNGSGFRITAENGDRYFFEEAETTHHTQVEGALYIPDHQSSWFLTKIISADLADTIHYHYGEYSFYQHPMSFDTYTINTTDGNAIGNDLHNWVVTGSVSDQVDAKLLSRINYKNTTIHFNPGAAREDTYEGANALGSIVVTSALSVGSFTKTFYLSHDYLNGKLNLRGIDILDNTSDSVSAQKYRFEYEGGLEGTGLYDWENVNRNIDRWGYYNGSSNYNKMLFAEEDVYDAHYTYGNRSPNFNYCKTNVLKKLIYPTGGYTAFLYEQNKLNNLDDGPGLRVKKIAFFDNIDTVNAALVKEYLYSGSTAAFNSGVYQNTVTIHGELCDEGPEGGGSGCESEPRPMNKPEITYQAGIASALNDFLSTPFYYSGVIEINRSASANGKTAYVFSSYGEQDPDVYLARKTDSALVNNVFVPLKEQANTYALTDKFIFMGVTARLTDKSYAPTACFGCVELTSPDITQPVYGLEKAYAAVPSPMVSSYKTLQQTTERSWNENGHDSLVLVTSYFYDNPDHTYPTKTITRNSKGDSLISYMKYPLDYLPASCSTRTNIDTNFRNAKITAMQNYGDCYWDLVYDLEPHQTYTAHETAFLVVVNSYHCEDTLKAVSARVFAARDTAWAHQYAALSAAQSGSSVAWKTSLYWMLKNNIFSPLIEKYTTIKKNGIEYVLTASRNDFSLITNNTSAITAKLTAVRQAEIRGNLLKSDFLADSTYYKKQAEMEYDANLNLVSQWKTNDSKQSYVWSYNNQYPVAGISNAAYADIAYSSFESDGKGNWDYVSSGMNADSGSVTGRMSYTLSTGNIERTALDNTKKYLLTYWVKNNGGTVSINGSSSATLLLTKNGWKLYQRGIQDTSMVTVSGTGVIDELRLYPVNAQMTTNTFDPLIGLTSQCDANNRVMYYEYDTFNRLLRIRDHNRNILKSFTYSYKVAQ